VPPLRRRGADNLALRGHSAGGADGTVALVLGGRLYVCDDERCRAHEGPSSWGWVEPVAGTRFLALRAAPRDAPLSGAVLVDAAPILAAP
ncbi:MAG TPA: hypothetical protein RMG45_05430, partial [Polyangiaceae bacterium LLY-WYZ-15_(1-7)]|nr:hypothetical protein [Polyangiaceae bacterium LLY-WYZ-15_(1-7)]